MTLRVRRSIQVLSGVAFGALMTLVFVAPPGGRSSPIRAPEVPLVDHTGAARALADFKGEWTVVFFGFTQCPDICPLALQRVAAGLRALEGRPEAEARELAQRLEVVLVTVDPARDTPPRLAEFLGGIHPRFVGLTGDSARLAEVWRTFAVDVTAAGPPDSEAHAGHEMGGDPDPNASTAAATGAELGHTASLFLLDPRSRHVGEIPPWPDPDAMADDLLRWVRGS